MGKTRPPCKLIVLVIGLFLSTIGYAEEAKDGYLKFRFAPYSHHFSHKGDPNENNFLFGVEYEKWLAATFMNSQSERTWLVGYNFFFKEHRITNELYWSASIPAGLAYGYESDHVSNYDGFTLFAILNAGLGYHVSSSLQIGANLNYLPTGDGGVLLPEVQMGFRF